jgi:hypothetical protein
VRVESSVAGDPLVQAATRASIGTMANQRFTVGQPRGGMSSRPTGPFADPSGSPGPADRHQRCLFCQ